MSNATFTIWRTSRWLFLPMWIFALFLFWKPVGAMFALSLHDDRYSHLFLIPVISVLLMFRDRQKIFSPARTGFLAAALLFVLAAIMAWISHPWSSASTRNEGLWMPALAIVLLWAAIFTFVNGDSSAHAALFPLCFLVLMIPAPSHLLDYAVYGLQKGSAEVTQLLFKVLGVPVLRHDFRFALPGLEIEIAEECSGIRSSMALLITGAAAAQLFLRSTWTKLGFILFTIPVAIFKNGIRIVTLSWLSVYVNPWFLNGPLHHSGGALFALVGLAILFPVLLLLQKYEVANPRPLP